MWIGYEGEDEVVVMNELQDAGLVSDNAVWAREVSDGDGDRAVEYMEGR